MPPQISSVSISQMTSAFAPCTGASLKPTPRHAFASGMLNSIRSRATVGGSGLCRRRMLTGRAGSFARSQAASTCSAVTFPAAASTMLPGL